MTTGDAVLAWVVLGCLWGICGLLAIEAFFA